MKIGFVNQAIDTILPPYQNSLGACTYGLVSHLQRQSSCEIVVYGLADLNKDKKTDTFGKNVAFRFFPSTRIDKLVNRARTELSKIVQLSSPASTSSWLFPEYGRQVAIDLAKQQCDVIHIEQSSQYAPIIRAFNPKARIVLHIQAEWLSQSNYKVLERRLRDVDLFTCVSNHVANKANHDIPMVADRCEVRYNGVEPSEFFREKDYKAMRGLKPKRILFVGAVSPNKGLHVVLDAFNLVTRSYPDVYLDLVGPLSNYPLEECFDFADRELIKRVAPFYATNRIERLKAKLSLSPADAGTYQSYLKSILPSDIAAKVSFHGHVGTREELVDHYYNADVFVFTPIWEEGFGIPVIEAMAAGAPVVGSRSGALVETIKHGETGILVDKNDARGVAEALLKLLREDSLRESMGRAARRRVLEHFTWDNIAEQMHVRYAALCGLNAQDMHTGARF